MHAIRSAPRASLYLACAPRSATPNRACAPRSAPSESKRPLKSPITNAICATACTATTRTTAANSDDHSPPPAKEGHLLLLALFPILSRIPLILRGPK